MTGKLYDLAACIILDEIMCSRHRMTSLGVVIQPFTAWEAPTHGNVWNTSTVSGNMAGILPCRGQRLGDFLCDPG